MTYKELSEHYDLLECTICHCAVTRTGAQHHINWHKIPTKKDKDKSPEEIRQEACKELAKIQQGE